MELCLFFVRQKTAYALRIIDWSSDVCSSDLLDGLNRIRHLPAVIVQGRYDMICPTVTADELARAWPEARYEIVPDAGHSALEPGIRAALVEATEGMRGHLAMETSWDERRMP